MLWLRVHRPMLHGLAFLVAAGICVAISSFPVPAAPPDPLSAKRDHLAYGYLYLPLLTLPIISSFLQSPMRWVERLNPRRCAAIDAGILGIVAVCSSAAALLTGLLSGDPGAWVVALTNMFAVIALLGVCTHLLSAAWAWLIPFVYAALGIMLSSNPILLINRIESLPRLIVSAAVLIVVIALSGLGVLRRRN